MASEDGSVRISISVPEEVNNKLNAFLPWGTKAEVIRALIDTLIRTQSVSNRYIMQDLIDGRCDLIVRE